jgi:hypothetical protein
VIPRAKRRHRDVIGPAIGTHDRLVMAEPARHVVRPHAELAHVAERHRFDRLAKDDASAQVVVRHLRDAAPRRGWLAACCLPLTCGCRGGELGMLSLFPKEHRGSRNSQAQVPPTPLP